LAPADAAAIGKLDVGGATAAQASEEEQKQDAFAEDRSARLMAGSA
jgi:hypothetical protein